jgi:hypothetical protein
MYLTTDYTDYTDSLEFPGQGKKIYARGEISRLNNSIYYFLQYVFIMVVENGFNLRVIHNNRLELDKVFKSLRGAKMAFTKLFKEKAWKNVQAEWSPFYDPDKYWIVEKNQIVLRAMSSCPAAEDLVE